MQKRTSTILFSLFISLCSLVAIAAYIGTTTTKVAATGAATTYVVTFHEDTTVDTMNAVLQSKGLTAAKTFAELGMAIVATNDSTAVSQLTQNVNVEGVNKEGRMRVPDFNMNGYQPTPAPTPITVTDPLYVSSQWAIRRLKAPEAWNNGQTASHNTVVAIIDTGIASNHPDLAGNLVYQKCFTSFQTTCNPYPNVVGANHGTRVAGVLGAQINGVGIVGVAPNVGIASYNVAEIGPDGIPTVFDSSMWAAIEDATNQKFEVISLSAGELFPLPLSADDQARLKSWERVIKKANKKGLSFFASAGNQGVNLNDPANLMVPCELKYVQCVGATNIRPLPVYPQPGSFDEAAFYSNYGVGAVDFAAPGGDCGGPDFNTCLTAPDPRYFIWTTDVRPDPTCGATLNCPVTYTASIGTSFSAPKAAGVAALVIDAYRSKTGKALDPDKVAKILSKTAEKLPNYPQLGAGILNADAAVKEALKEAKKH